VLASNDINAEVARLQQLRSEASASPSEKLRLLATIAFDEPALIFTGAVATANAIYNALKSTRCCGLVTARGSRDAIDAFKRGRIDVLVATDLAAEGLNLQRAGIVVHFDIPWNPVKLDQRNGRAHRIGQTRDEVRAIYFIPEERTTGIVETVAAKNRTRRRALAGGSVEGHPSVVALPSHMPRDAAPVALLQAIQRRGLAPPPALLRRWRAGVELLMIELSREFLDARKIADLAAILDAELTVSRASE
jgi:superfamily II DNA/RNA helicase